MDQLAKLESAYNSFKEIYKALPGDFTSTSIPLFGTIADGISILYGDGNNIIDNGTNSQSRYESLIALQHLSLAGLIAGNFSGDWSNNAALRFLPLYNDKGYYFGNVSISNNVSSNVDFTNNRSVIFYSRIFDSNSNGVINVSSETLLSVISPTDMYKIDYKYDDGFPNTGNVLSFNGTDNSSGCISQLTTPNTYKISNSDGCYFNVILDKSFYDG
ncbi:MAG: hypothetical protein EOP34_09025 [Rickettsiales bacterium]|nr:MAG: hypothetical protein EOP34_09025 [Rickettsiales bacterium]